MRISVRSGIAQPVVVGLAVSKKKLLHKLTWSRHVVLHVLFVVGYYVRQLWQDLIFAPTLTIDQSLQSRPT